MICRVCGSDMEERVSDLPFKTGDQAIVIVKGVPVIQCGGCNEYLLSDRVMADIEQLLDAADHGAELEIVRYANAA